MICMVFLYKKTSKQKDNRRNLGVACIFLSPWLKIEFTKIE